MSKRQAKACSEVRSILNSKMEVIEHSDTIVPITIPVKEPEMLY